MDECIKHNDVYEFAKDQIVKETGAYSRGLNAGLKIMMSAARNKDAIASVAVRPAVQKDALLSALREYFSIGDSYTYELTRVKSAFEIGTVGFDDFEEWGEEKILDLCEYLMRVCLDHGAVVHEGGVSPGGEFADNPTLAPA